MRLHRIQPLNLYMKKLFTLFALMVACVAVMRAESGWYMVTNTDERIPMQSVGMLVVADDHKTFTVVKTEGAGAAVSGVTSVSFSYDSVITGIGQSVADEVSILPDAVSSTITLMGCQGRQLDIIDMAGKMCKSVAIADNSQRVDVSSLAAGMYILRAGNATVKFIKR